MQSLDQHLKLARALVVATSIPVGLFLTADGIARNCLGSPAGNGGDIALVECWFGVVFGSFGVSLLFTRIGWAMLIAFLTPGVCVFAFYYYVVGYLVWLNVWSD